MKILCKYSGLQFQAQHFPFTLESRESYHPVFQIPQKKLIHLIAKRYPADLNPIDSYLAFLALLKSTSRIDFRTAAMYLPHSTDSIVAQNMEPLLRIANILQMVNHPAFVLPSFVISPETASLANIPHWIDIWLDCYKQFQSGNKAAALHDRIVRREQAMERMIKDSTKNPANYATQLAEWASLAGSFPIGDTPVAGKLVSLAEYWKSIIRKAARGEAIFEIDDGDLAELIEHCEDTIAANHASIYSQKLMVVLRDAAESKRNFLGLNDFDIRTSTYRILSATDTIENANIMAMIDSAPLAQPIETNYPSKIAFLRAQFRWKAAQIHGQQLESEASAISSVSAVNLFTAAKTLENL